jgi:hypothetical protein
VSHQAGTPAISSALQFCSIAKFGDRVQFLVLNREYEEHESISKTKLVESSEYIRAIKLEQAKQLIRQGEPGAALSLIQGDVAKDLEKLEKELELINARINLRQVEVKSEDKNPEFEPLEAAQRIDDMLDVVELLIKNKKYALAMTALTAAHEAFLKASIKFLLPTSNLTSIKIVEQGKEKVIELKDYNVTWDNEALKLKPKNIEPKKSFLKYKTLIY